MKEDDRDIDPLITSRTNCQLNPSFEYKCDVKFFFNEVNTPPGRGRVKALESMVERYKGPLLDGFSLRNLPQWEEWLFHRREELHQHYSSAALELGDYYLTNNDSDSAIQLYIQVLKHIPDLEPAHEGIIRAYADQGKVSAALRHYNYYVEIMKREMNAPQCLEIEKLVDELRTGKYEKSPSAKKQTYPPEITRTIEPDESETITSRFEPDAPDEPTRPIEETSDSFSEQVSSPELEKKGRFIGRERELGELHHLLSEVGRSNGQVLIISGEMGIGKTRLFNQFLEIVPDSFFIGIGESEEIVPTQLLQELMQILDMIGKSQNLPDSLRKGMADLFEIQKQVQISKEENLEHNLIDGIRRWIVELAGHAPVLIALDDMHWASDAVLNVFSSLAQEAKRLPILLVGIFRTFELQSEDAIAASLINMARTGRLWRIELDKLTADEIKQLIESQSYGLCENLRDCDLERIYRFSSGIPLFAIELSNFLAEGRKDILSSPILDDQPDFYLGADDELVPPLMMTITNLRLSRLDNPDINVLKFASLLLGNFSLELISDLVDFDQDQLEEILVNLEHRNFLKHFESGDKLSFGFKHQMVKLAISKTIPLLERRRHFKQIAEVIENTSEEISSDAKGYYLFNAGKQTGAIPHLIASSRLWFNYGDTKKAMSYSKIAYKVAIEKLDDEPDSMLQVIMTHAENLTSHGLLRAAIDVYNDVITRMEKSSDSQSKISLLARRDKIKELLSRKPDAELKAFTPLVLATTKRALANTKLMHGDIEGSRVLLDEVDHMLELVKDSPATNRETGMTLQVRAKLAINESQFSKAAQLLKNAMELLQSHGTSAELTENLRLLGEVYRKQGAFDRAGEAFEQCQSLALSTNNLLELGYCNYGQGLLALDQGNLEEAESLLHRAVELCRAFPEASSHVPPMMLDLVKALTKNGHLEDAEKLAEKAETLMKELNDTEGLAQLDEIRKQYRD